MTKKEIGDKITSEKSFKLLRQKEIVDLQELNNHMAKELHQSGFFTILFSTKHKKKKEEYQRNQVKINEIEKVLSSINSIIKFFEERLDILTIQEKNIYSKITKFEGHAAQVQCNINELQKDLSRQHLEELEKTLADEKHNLNQQKESLKVNYDGRLIIGTTLDGFIGRSNIGFKVDKIFVDEAAYAPIVKLIPLMSLNAPICLLGDHLQLPPVCEADERNTTINAYWGKSAIFIEEAWLYGDEYKKISEAEEPKFQNLLKLTLKESFRFSNELAAILDHSIYDNIGFHGNDSAKTNIRVIHCKHERQMGDEKRVNKSEVEAIQAYLFSHRNDIISSALNFCILTPYKNQSKELRKIVKKNKLDEYVDVLNTHQGQGREWDVVLFSVVDGNLPQCNPFFTNSKMHQGKIVLNTTISRVKKELIIFMDCSYWQNKEGQLLSQIIDIYFKSQQNEVSLTPF